MNQSEKISRKLEKDLKLVEAQRDGFIKLAARRARDWKRLKVFLAETAKGAIRETGTSLYFTEVLKRMESIERGKA